ncbi:MAG: tat (twin-arginine translocation) pathway signal sequence, partial [Ignavibacteriaceae bacterium]|nr:tat (twin-arginine translocation) pathway signal sequence [Ignavibacteriaceae bacterium]
DIVAADAAAAKLFGLDPQNIDYIKIASEMKLGELDLNKLNINRIIL